MQIAQFAALSACAILAGLAIFQAALVSGAPLGRMAWGGQHDVLPTRLRIGSAISLALYALFGLAALARAEMTLPIINDAVTAVFVWVLTAYFALGVVMNGLSRSKPERVIMTPVALVLTALYLVVAIS